MHSLLSAAALAALALVSVSLWTVRVAFTADRRLVAAAVVAAIEATTFAAAFSKLLGSIDSPVSLGAYAFGVAAGTAAALQIEAAIGGRSTPADPGAQVCLSSTGASDSSSACQSSGSANGNSTNLDAPTSR